jgi:hypothetical protein
MYAELYFVIIKTIFPKIIFQQMMKIFLSILLLSSSLIIFGQDEPGTFTHSDSLTKKMSENIIPPVSVKPDFFIPLSAVNNFSISLKLGINPFIPFPDNISELNNNLYFSQSILKEQFKSSFLYTMLGAVQTGAVGYMAYRHIKKYGLFK